MPPEPNEKIEGILKRYVQKRREALPANFDLHPATRKMLQGEAARTFSRSDAKTKPTFFLAFWPRLAFVGIFTGLLAATVLVLNTPKKSAFELSQRSDQLSAPAPAPREQAGKETPVTALSAGKRELAKMNAPGSAAPASTPAPSQTPVVTRGGTDLSVADRFEKQFSEPLGRTAPSRNEIDAVSNAIEVSADKKDELGIRAGKTATVTALTNSASIAISPPLSSNSTAGATAYFYDDPAVSARRRFVQQDSRVKYRLNLLSPAQPKILQTFELSRVGNRIQLIENDGSVYDGELLDAAKNVFGRNNSKSKAEPTPEFAFSVVGTNRQLNRVVTISGSFAPANENLIANGKPSAQARDSFYAGEFKRTSGAAGHGAIQAKVSIGGTNEFEIQATEVPK